MIEHIGWQCPICQKVYAPWIIECNCCKQQSDECSDYYSGLAKTQQSEKERLKAIAQSHSRNGCDHVFETVRAGCDDYEFKCIKCGFTKKFTSNGDKFAEKQALGKHDYE